MADEHNQVQVNPIKFWKQVVLGINDQLEDVTKDLKKVLDGFEGEGTGDVARAQANFRDFFESIKMLNAMTAQSETSLASIQSMPEANNYLRTQFNDTSVIIANANELLTAINKIEYMLSTECRYQEVASLLELINAEWLHLSKFQQIPRLEALHKRHEAIKRVLRRKIFYDYREIGLITELDVKTREKSKSVNESASDVSTESAMPPPPPTAAKSPLDALDNAHMVISAMGADTVLDLMDQIVHTQLLNYHKAGSPGGFLYNLNAETLEKRWAGFRKLLAACEAKTTDIFPQGWYFPQRLYIEFADRTRDHLMHLLTDAEMREDLEEQQHVALLINSLKSVQKFEEEMTARFEESCVALNVSDEVEELLGRIQEGNVISVMYDDFMGPYIILERRNLEEVIKKLVSQDRMAARAEAQPGGPHAAPAVEGSEATVTFDSAARMFEAIKSSMKRCIPLTTGQPFVNLSMEFRTCIALYARAMKARLPTPVPSAKATGQETLVYKLNRDLETLVCRVINTAEYCGEVVPQMEGLIKEKVNPMLADRVNLKEQGDIFTDLIAFAIGILVSGIAHKQDEPFKVMRRMDWSKVEVVGDDSVYVGQLRAVVAEFMPRMRDSLSPLNFKSLATKMGLAILTRFETIVLSRKKITTVGAEQLLLDLNGIHTFCRDIHNLGLPANSPKRIQIPTVHLSVIGNQAKRVQNILKLVCTEEDQLEHIYDLLMPGGPPELLDNVRQLKQGKDVLTSAVGAVGSVGNDFGRAMDKAIDKVGDKMVDSTTRMVGGTAKAMTAVGGTTTRAMGAMGETIGSSFGSMGKDTKTAMSKMGGKTVSAMKSSVNVLKAVGQFTKTKSDRSLDGAKSP